jgi:hypothetical protein
MDKAKPILFSGPMVRAILEGRKTMTRRVLNPKPTKPWGSMFHEGRRWWTGNDFTADVIEELNVPHAVGDRLWVKEQLLPGPYNTSIVYEADGTVAVVQEWPWQVKVLPSMFCPRRFSRITLEVTGVKMERLQDISEADAIAEGVDQLSECRWRDHLGVDPDHYINATASFVSLWESINGPGSWDANPWVAAYSFRLATQHREGT